MPILVPGARGLVQGQWAYHALHTQSPPTPDNEVTGSGYAREAAVWAPNAEYLEPAAEVQFNTTGSVGQWGTIRSVGIWNGTGPGSTLMGYVVLGDPIVTSDLEDTSAVRIDADVLRLAIGGSVFTEAGIRALFDGTILTAGQTARLHVDDNGDVGDEISSATNNGYDSFALFGSLLALSPEPNVALQNAATMVFGTAATSNWSDVPAWLTIEETATGTRLLAVPTNLASAPASGNQVQVASSAMDIDLLQGTALENQAFVSLITDDNIGTAVQEVANTNIAPSRRAVALAVDTTNANIQAAQPNLGDVFQGARISGDRLIFIQRDGSEEFVTLPTSTEVADGVVVSAVVPDGQKTAILTTSEGDTINLDLSVFARLSEVEDFSRTANPNSQVPANKLGNQRFTVADENKLDGIQERAERNVGVEYTTTEKAKLAGVAPGATNTNITGLFNNARVQGNNLIFAREGRPELLVALPVQQGGADGVVTDATFNPTTKQVVLEISGGTEVVVDLSALAATSDLAMLFDDARISGNQLILTRVNDADIRLDLPVQTGGDTDRYLIRATLNATTKMVTMELSDGSTFLLDLSAFVTVDGQRFTAADETKLDGIAPGAQVNPDIGDLFNDASINLGILTLNQVDGTSVALTLPTGTAVADGVVTSATLDPTTKIVTLTTSEGDTVALNLSALALVTDIPFVGNHLVSAVLVGNRLTFRNDGGTSFNLDLPAAEGGLTEVETDNFIVGSGTTEDPVELDDDALFTDWIGDFDTPVAASAVFTGQVGAMPGNYSWRTVVIAVATPNMAATTQVRRLRGTAHFQELSQSGGAPVAYRARFRNQAGTILGNAKFDDPGGDSAQIDIEIPIGTTGVSGLLQVQGAGQYRANVRFTNMRFHDGAGRLKDEIQAEIHEGTQHLTDNAFVGAEFAPVNRNLTFHRDGGVDQVVNIPEQDVSDFFNGASINLGILTFNQADGTSVALTLPTGTAVADGVVTSATLNNTTKIVRIVTSTGDTVNLNLSDMAALRELERWAQVGNTALVPDAKIDTAIARVSALPRTGQLVPAGGTGGQVLGKTSATDYDTEWVDGGVSTGSGNTTHLVGQGNFDVTVANNFATEANSADITLDDSDWFLFNIGAITTGPNIDGHWAWIRGDDWRGLVPARYGLVVSETNSRTVLGVSNLSNAYRIGRTTDNKVLLSSSSANRDSTPLTIRGVNEATPPTFLSLPETPNTPGSPGQALIWNPAGDALVNADRGEAGVVTLEAGVSDLPIGPVRQVTRGTVPDDTATIPNATTFVLPLATAGRTLHESLTVAADNNSINVVNAGSYYISLDMEAEASTQTDRHVAVAGNGVLRAEGTIQVLVNDAVRARGVMSYARYGGWQVDGIGGTLLVVEAGDTIRLAAHVRRIDTGVGSLEWTGSVCLKHQYVAGNALPGAGIESDTVNNIRVLTQAQYDAIASPDAGTLYVISS